MLFKEHDAEARRVALSTVDYGIDSVERARDALLKQLTSAPDGWGEVRGASLTVGSERNLTVTALGRTIHGIFEVVNAGGSLGGRYTFHLIQVSGIGDLTSEPVFSIEFDANWRLRFGTEGSFAAMIEPPVHNPGAVRRRLLENLLTIVYQRLNTIPV